MLAGIVAAIKQGVDIPLSTPAAGLLLTGAIPTAAQGSPALVPSERDMILSAASPQALISYPSYTPSAVKFGGSTWLQRHAWLTGVSNAQKFSVSVWHRLFNANDGLFASDFGNIVQGVTTIGGIKYYNVNASDSYFDSTPDGGPAAGGPMQSNAMQHFAFSVDLTNAPTIEVRMLINGVSVLSTSSLSPGTGSVMTDGTDFFFGDDSFGQRITGHVADVQIWYGTFIDFSDIVEMRRFVAADGLPVQPSIPAGIYGQQTILFSGDASGFPTNQGSSGTFTLHGSLSTVDFAQPNPSPTAAALSLTGPAPTRTP